MRRGDQDEYNRLLDAFGGKNKSFQENVYYLIGLGYLYSQAKNAVHVYFKGGATHASSPLTREIRDELLNNFNATSKTNKECVDYLRSLGFTYRQATTAVHRYRQEKGLIGK